MVKIILIISKIQIIYIIGIKLFLYLRLFKDFSFNFIWRLTIFFVQNFILRTVYYLLIKQAIKLKINHFLNLVCQFPFFLDIFIYLIFKLYICVYFLFKNKTSYSIRF